MNDVAEVWRPIGGWEGFYEVSNLGRVKSVERTLMRSNGRPMTIHCRILKSAPNPNGYTSVALCRDGVCATKAVHMFVTRAFLGECPASQEVRHRDGDPGNPRLDNLIYGTKSQNQLDRVEHGTSNRGEQHPNAKLNREQIVAIRSMAGTMSHRDIGECFGIGKEYTRSIIRRRTWSWL